jgi:hypothetical protein
LFRSEALRFYGTVLTGINKICKTNPHWDIVLFMLKYNSLTRHGCDLLTQFGIGASMRYLDGQRKVLEKEQLENVRSCPEALFVV